MKKAWLQRTAAALLAAVLGLCLAACGGSSAPPAATAAPDAGSAADTPESSGTRTGLGIYTGCSTDGLSGKATSTAAGVLLDADGRILRCVIDSAENEVAANPDGTLALPPAAGTKWEQGENYGMREASSIDREWYEQAQAFCAYIEGMTAAEVAAVETQNGKPSDPDLAAGCTMHITPLVLAVERACENAASRGAGKNDTLHLGIVSAVTGTDAIDDADGLITVASTFALLTLNTEEVITSAVLDEVEPAFSVDTTGSVTEPGSAVRSKLAQGETYGMREASSIGREWYEQSEGFCRLLTGKTVSELRGIPSNGADADLASVCTINITAFLASAVKAVNSAA